MRYPAPEIELVPLSRLEAAPYNPRQADPVRLSLLLLSLRKLGFLLPLYVNRNYRVMSGHQRLEVARRLGLSVVPVVRLDVPENKEKSINLLFNTITNDVKRDKPAHAALEEDVLGDLAKMMADVPDLPKEQMYPCLQMKRVPLGELLARCAVTYDAGTVGHAEMMLAEGVVVPVIRSESGEIVNGNWRVLAAAERLQRLTTLSKEEIERETYPVVELEERKVGCARVMLNAVSMRFDFRRIADDLRRGAYRRVSLQRKEIYPVLRWLVEGRKTGSMPFPEFRARFREVYGTSILDLGAGHRSMSELLRPLDVQVVEWEPYPLPKENEPYPNKAKPCLELARQISETFLKAVEEKVHWTTVCANAVLNSIPFHEDRVMFLTLAHACCSFDSLFVCSVRVDSDVERQISANFARVDEKGKIQAPTTTMLVDFEPGTTLAHINDDPKIQRCMSRKELKDLLSRFWAKVEITQKGNMYMAVCRYPRRPSSSLLVKALQFEFDLPYGNERLAMVDRALQAFSRRLGIELRERSSR